MKSATAQSRSQVGSLTLVNLLRPRGSRAFSMVETLLSVVLVGGRLVVALDTAGSAVAGRYMTQERGRGALLAQALMAEILPLSYEEPVDPPTFGRESGENGGDRAGYDDVDDYHTWTSNPPEYRDGTVLPGLSAWERAVVVDYVDPNDLTTVVGSDQGVKRITITVTRNEIVTASLVAVRALAYDVVSGS